MATRITQKRLRERRLQDRVAAVQASLNAVGLALHQHRDRFVEGLVVEALLELHALLDDIHEPRLPKVTPMRKTKPKSS